MAHTIAPCSKHVLPQPMTDTGPVTNDNLTYKELLRNLEQQRTLLLGSMNLSFIADEEPEFASDLADQAAIECEQDLAMQGKLPAESERQ